MAYRTGLWACQQARGGKFVDFHGWDMPVQFQGITAEHQVVRTLVGVFDLGHMGRLRVSGAKALAYLSRRVCRRLSDLAPGGVRYGLVLAEDGTVVDDVLVSREGPESFHVVVNAGNKEAILALWQAEPGVAIADLSAAEAMIAVQGPQAAALLAGLGLDGRAERYYSFLDAAWQGTPVRLSRTGYTGEDGFECFLANDRAEAFWLALVAAGAQPCGLGCRDTLRLEAGMPLYGNELDRSVTPVEAGLAFAVDKQGGFIGDRVVLEQLARGPARRLVGLTMAEKRVPRHGYALLSGGAAVGVITSGTLSPTLGVPIGMGYVPTALAAIGTALEVDVRGTRCAAQVCAMPFYKRAKG